MKHIISQLDGQDDCEVNQNYYEKKLCPLCPKGSDYCEKEKKRKKYEECDCLDTDEEFN